MSSFSSNGKVRGSGVLYAVMVVMSTALLLTALWGPQASVAGPSPAAQQLVASAHPQAAS